MAVSFDQREGDIWLNGTFVPWSEARCHILTHALHYASSVFEGERVYDGAIFKSEAHTRRLFDSARTMGFEIPFAEADITAAKDATVRRMGLTDAYVRPIAWRGSEMMGVSAQQNTIHVAIAAWPWPSYFDPTARQTGIRLDIADWRRPDPRSAPCKAKAAGLYMICTLSKHAAEAKGYHDALMLDLDGNVAEATGANIFFERDGRLHTPTPWNFLDGITRRTVIDLAHARGIDVVERTIAPEEMVSFDACFLTGTAAEVTPVGEIGPYRFTVSAMTRQLMADYASAVRAPAAVAAQAAA